MTRGSKKRIWPWIAVLISGLAAAKLMWFVAEWVWLSPVGVDRPDIKRIKPLYYRIRLTTQGKAPEVPKPKPTPVRPAETISALKLLGVYSASDDAVVAVRYKNKDKVIATGESVGGFVLKRAGRDYAVFEKSGKRYTIYLKAPKKHTASVSYSTPIASTKVSEAVPDNADEDIREENGRKVVKRDLLLEFTGNPKEIYKNVGIKDYKEEGKIKGFRITFVKRGSVFAKLGLRRGDILKAINGQPLDSYKAAFDAYRHIDEMDTVTLRIQRGNQEMELEYEID